MTKKTILLLVKTVLPLALGIYLFWYFFSKMTDGHIISFRKAVREANYFWIVLSLVFSFIALYARASRWKYMLEPLGYKTPVKNRYHALMIGYLINFTIPRAGEPSRAAMLYRSDGVPFSKSFGTIIGERAFDLVMLGMVTGITMLIGYEDLSIIFNEISELGAKPNEDNGFGIKQIILICFGVLFLGGLLLLIYKQSIRHKLIQFVKDVLNGVFSVFKTKNPGAFIFYTLLIWVCYLAMFIVPFFGLKETADFPLSGFFIGFVAGSVGISLTNGGIGVYPLLVGMVVAFYLKNDLPVKEAEGIGNALGMIVWVSQTIFMVLLGLISLALLPKNYSKNDDTSRQPSEQNS